MVWWRRGRRRPSIQLIGRLDRARRRTNRGFGDGVNPVARRAGTQHEPGEEQQKTPFHASKRYRRRSRPDDHGQMAGSGDMNATAVRDPRAGRRRRSDGPAGPRRARGKPDLLRQRPPHRGQAPSARTPTARWRRRRAPPTPESRPRVRDAEALTDVRGLSDSPGASPVSASISGRGAFDRVGGDDDDRYTQPPSERPATPLGGG